MPDFKNRVLSFFLVGIMLVFILLALIVGGLVHYNVKEKRLQSYQSELQLVSLAAVNKDTGLLEKQLDRAEKDLGGKLLYLSPKGKVLAQSKSEKEAVPDQPLNGLDEYKGSSLVSTKDMDRLVYTLPVKNQTSGSLEGYVQLVIPEKTANSTERSIWLAMSLGFLISLVIILFVSIRVLNRIVKPVEEATSTAKELARGNFKARTYEYKGDVGELNFSLNVLARNLEKMTKSYESQQDRLKTLIENMGSGLILIDSDGYITIVNRAFKEIFKEYTDSWTSHLFHEVFPYKEIKEIVEDTFIMETNIRKQVVLPIHIERKNFDVYSAPVLNSLGKLRGIVLVFHDITELKKLEQMRKDFVANVSHELKTPVTSLKGFAETLLDGADGNPEIRKKFLTIMWNESDRLQHLIQDLLDLSKVEQGFSLNLQKVSLSTIVEEVIVMLETKAQEKEITIKYSAEGNTMIEGDSPRLKQVFINLINNSLNYTPKGGRITIRLKESSEKVTFSVSDTGIGIHKEEVSRIFERFYRVDKARSRNSGGTGLGLAIVKHLVEAHRGRIHVKSKPGEGSTFTLVFKKEFND
ncbi:MULTISPECIES: two-component system histidine kinase PnpS [unclassified Fictibacillus]|uniref:two-component system histidine kinase PnpS n=1 Tax=unclassified Fictibacillus TaxID=2644029 RepID=UPI0008E8DC26|nr:MULTISPECIES: HAMP domain-containing sensor histidine kinase [unclassified Fictibacillus]MED2971522.1 ATP-binding protein [Fictibacillus sp. B-59209]UZJ80325.1 ATP-binding protein [Fictibacillus sp. KU28468]SFD59457.1 two-component system, OmpR family, phosphate regulon sensor histidine kinase PhoR [Bacillus sp. OV194]